MIARRSLSLYEDQRAISWRERRQPSHSPSDRLMTQTAMQGDSIIFSVSWLQRRELTAI
jgi:hypothetical protein